MLVREPKMRVFQKALIVLLAAIFGLAAVTPAALGGNPTRCKCCVADAADTPCSTSCCRAPVRQEIPLPRLRFPRNETLIGKVRLWRRRSKSRWIDRRLMFFLQLPLVPCRCERSPSSSGIARI